MSLYGVELNHQLNRIITEMRLTLQKQKFVPNVRTIYRSFAQLDPDIIGLLPPALFEKALNQNGIFFKNVDLKVLLKAFGTQHGAISWFQFLQTLKVSMNEVRRNLINSIYESLAQQHQRLSPEVIAQQFDPAQIDIVKNGKISAQNAREQLTMLLYFSEGQLTQEEFVAFYEDLTLNFPHDDPFIKYVSRQWGYVLEGAGRVSEQALRSIIKALRFKLIQKSKGTNDEFLLRKLFNEFDDNKNGYISAFELDLMLKQLELPIGAEFVEPLFRKLDKNSSGMIQYDEFKHFIFFDPFPA